MRRQSTTGRCPAADAALKLKIHVMKARTFLLILGITAIVVSCIPSLYPLYREKDLLLDEKLEGTFNSGENEYWKIRHLDSGETGDLQGDWKSYRSGYTYRLSVTEEGVTEDFALHLLKLGQHQYLDFFPVGYDIRPDFLEMHLAPSHIFARVEIKDECLVVHFFDPDWLEDLIDKERIRISYVELPDRYLLTAKTEDLQKFILKFANDSTTFMEADTLPRMQLAHNY